MTDNRPLRTGEPLRHPMDDHSGETALLSEAAESAEPSTFSNWHCQEAIHKTVVWLLEESRPAEEQRWTARTPYVRLACVRFRSSRRSEPTTDVAIPVATTDLSFEGIGVLSWQKIPVRRLLLEVSGVCFTCNVRWCETLGHEMYRYGLHLCDVATSPSHQ